VNMPGPARRAWRLGRMHAAVGRVGGDVLAVGLERPQCADVEVQCLRR
jgi:hypothetical protein